MRRWIRTCLALAVLSVAAQARADFLDFQIYKIGPSHSDATGTNQKNFRIFANQLGVAITSVDMSPPETVGHSGFNVALGYSVAKIGDVRTEVWPTAGKPPTDALLMPTVMVRKGLPFSFELSGRFAYLTYSQMAAATIEVKWALNEGFIYLPDLGVRGHGTRLIGSRDFGLTTAGVDVGIGKQFAVGGMVTLTPYGGWDYILVSCTTGVVDFNPARTSGVASSEDDAQTQPTKSTDVFDAVTMGQNHNSRIYLGLRLVTSVLELGLEGSVTQTMNNKQIVVATGKVGLDF